MAGQYRDIAAKIQDRIEAGEWEPGTKLPTLDTLAAELDVGRNVVHRALEVLETEGYVWSIQGSGTVVRWGTIRPRRPRGNLVKRNEQLTGYSFPSASSQEVWIRHGDGDKTPTRLDDERLAKLLGVPPGTVVPRRLRVTGPEAEPPFQIGRAWIHPRVADIVADVDANPAAGEWLYRIEQAGHWPISWLEIHRARMPTAEEARLLQIPVTFPVLEIVRQGTSGGDQKPIEVSEFVLASDRVETMQVLHRDTNAVDPWPKDPEGNERGEP